MRLAIVDGRHERAVFGDDELWIAAHAVAGLRSFEDDPGNRLGSRSLRSRHARADRVEQECCQEKRICGRPERHSHATHLVLTVESSETRTVRAMPSGDDRLADGAST